MQDSNDILFNEYSIDFVAFFNALEKGFGDGSRIGAQDAPGFFENLFDLLTLFWSVYSVLAYVLSAFLIYGIIYAYIRDNQLSDVENEIISNDEHLYKEVYGSKAKNSRWDDVLKHMETDNPNDWKLAIIESDILLAEALTKSGYAGVTIGEQLKSASSEMFANLDQAWKAHRVRNSIAHEGPDFILTKKLAQDTITQYKMVLQEFGMI